MPPLVTVAELETEVVELIDMADRRSEEVRTIDGLLPSGMSSMEIVAMANRNNRQLIAYCMYMYAQYVDLQHLTLVLLRYCTRSVVSKLGITGQRPKFSGY